MAFSENSVIKISELRDAIYPIGSVYLSVNNVSPQTFFGGTWIALEEGRTLWTANPNKDDNGNTISEGTNNLSDNESTWKIEAGLPNIKGRFALNGSPYSNLYAEKAFGHGTDIELNNIGMSGNSWLSQGKTYVFNASTYNSIYSDSITTVQPPSLRVFAWRRTA